MGQWIIVPLAWHNSPIQPCPTQLCTVSHTLCVRHSGFSPLWKQRWGFVPDENGSADHFHTPQFQFPYQAPLRGPRRGSGGREVRWVAPSTILSLNRLTRHTAASVRCHGDNVFLLNIWNISPLGGTVPSGINIAFLSPAIFHSFLLNFSDDASNSVEGNSRRLGPGG